jgi:signal transduction histidine kinase
MSIARSMRWVGYGLWGVSGVVPLCHPGVRLSTHPAWVVAYVAFGIAFHLGARSPADAEHSRLRLCALAVMVPAMFVMAAVLPCVFGALTLAVVASQVALVLPRRETLAWIVIQTGVVACFMIPEFGWTFGGGQLVALLGFQTFAAVATLSARGESDARAIVARTNAELVAMRSLLNEACRDQERQRIARDLHDALGHNLTALGLQLEVASLMDEPAARAQMAKARLLTARLLGDVREVVGRMKREHPSRLVNAIRALVIEVPGLALHLDVPESLIVEESSRVDCVVRCVQELVTNARRHARARNLWICLRREDDALSVEARDDGLGAPELSEGHGLEGMRSRFEEMGGWLKVDTGPERSFSIRACLPLRSEPALVGGGS